MQQKQTLINRQVLCNGFVCLLLILSGSKLAAQTKDSLQQPTRVKVEIFPDSVFTFRTKTPIPKRAGLYSACLPGLGQFYNRQYWKVGLVYGTAAVVTGFIVSNNKEYRKYRKAYIDMIDNDPGTPNTFENYTVDDVKILRDGFRKYLEYSIISGSVAYIFNILDAFVSAHLKTFDMSKDIGFMPLLNKDGQVGLKVVVAIR